MGAAPVVEALAAVPYLSRGDCAREACGGCIGACLCVLGNVGG